MLSRRAMLATTAGAAAGFANPGFLSRLRPLSAAEQSLDPDTVRLDGSIEPLVQLLERTARDELIETVAARVNNGLSYRELLAALLLAGVRNVEPRPTVGFQFHAVLVVNSAHLASLSSPAADRWLPIFWAIDYFKSAQARDQRDRDWTMAPVDDAALPPSHKAREQLIEGLETWDEAKADAAIARMARTHSLGEIFQLLFRYAARDFRSIGHKSIYVANSYRSLDVIGQQYAEPVLRSLVYAMLARTGDANPAESDLAADRPWRIHQARLEEFPADWEHGEAAPEAAGDLIATLRDADAEQAGDHVLDLLKDGVSPRSVWDALFDASSELMLRQPNIVALHAVTTTNAIYQCYRWSGNEEARKLLLLQNAAFLPMFLDGMRDRGSVPDRALSELKQAEPTEAGPDAIESIFDTLNRDRIDAARKTFAYLEAGGSPQALIDAARRLIFLKGSNAHDYKFSSAVLEDYYHVSPAWRNLYLAANVGRLRGTGDRDNPLVERIRSALA